ncbi:MAG TPA: Gfo/Idh/MocA family oxidoreductase [Candidatus Limiplasma stercoravium]|nr:Gfo/Idh/MocA family oxidoreductase [Candidatus Limiplasma stercoravium]
MERPISYALIGCGRIAPNHIAAVRNNGLDLAAVCDPVPQRMEAVLAPLPAQERQRVRRYTDYRDMLEREQPCLCAVATESGKHAAVGLDVLRAGANVIIEKPLALTLADARQLVAEAEARGLKLCACHQNRFNKSIQKIRTAVEEGRFGRMLHGTAHVRWNRGPDYYAQAPWRGTWAQDGGALMNQCIHSIDLLRWMMGDDVREVMAYTDNLIHDYIQAEDLGMALIRFGSGAYGIVEGTTNVYPHNLEETLYLFGENGTVKAGGKSVNIIEEWDFRDGRGDPATIKMEFAENPPNVYGYGHTPLYADMVDAIRNNRAPYVDGPAGMRALELVLAIYRSAAEHRPVALPLAEGSTLDFAGRFGR